MYQSIKLENFRAFPFLEITGLKPVNLFVGRNNAGKTSILEAIELLSSDRYPGTLLRLSASRERIYITTDEHTRIFDIDIRHLFTGHRLGENVWFQISAQSSEGKNRFFKCAVVSHDNSLEQQQAIHLTGSEINETIVMPLSEEGILKDEAHRRMRHPALASTVSIFLGTEGADPRKLRSLWDTMVLTDEEEEVYKALYPIAPDLERIAFTNSDRDRYYPSDNIIDAFVKLRNSTRVPLGTLGDGIRRLLGLAVFLVKSAEGYLLVDEIDTGLHYSTMEDMWRFVIQTANRLNVQVFATTHSSDCVRALAWLQQDEPELAEYVVLHRIEADATQSTRYSAEELEIAARHHIEVRG